MKPKTQKILARIVAIGWIVIGLCGSIVASRYLADHKTKNFNDEYIVYVYPETTAEQVINEIAQGAQADRKGSLRRCARKEDLVNRIQVGKYVVKPEHTAIYVVRMLCNGWQTTSRLTLSGTIRTKGRIAQRISDQMMVDSADVASLLDNPDFLSILGFTPENVLALFLPDTYEVHWSDSAEEIIRRFHSEYEKFWTAERLEKASELHLSPMEVSILASIVSGETLKAQEYPLIASVYLNRLRKGMLLQADPTVAFCFDYKLDRILKAHTKFDSPYNTYIYKGLPPAPINVPSKACIDAVLNPAQSNYLYFCASADLGGTRSFAAKNDVELKNARALHNALITR